MSEQLNDLQDGSARRAVLGSSPPSSRLIIDGTDVQAEGIAELREGITIEQAVQKTRRDRLDKVFFQANGKKYVAYGKGLQLPGGLQKEIQKQSYTALFGQVPASILTVQNPVNTAGEGAVEALKLLAIQAAIRVGVIGTGWGAGRLSETVARGLCKAKGWTNRVMEPVTRRTGVGLPVASLVVFGTLATLEVGAGALIGSRRQPDYRPIKEISQ